ncbi:hypothetical protein [Tenacibaculum jejuense]|uniref:Uncharacterized protein n=1 Tax=Tenacibaculum jejuense TaxID=584609 RepID=A0A238U4T8_9FLAO|nr:hypothetical protein [Tenacibaculum jejuense]SNR14213.1 conserved protein of unknown function [Tenacibaculum jejuense]
MEKTESYHFDLLKKELVATFLKTHNAPKNIEEWKGENIVLFQEDLFDKVKGKVSEKWFYTYCKKTPDKLPRIDILNLLSKYIGYENWNDFITKKEKSRAIPKKPLLFGILILLISIIGWTLVKPKTNEFVFCFVDQITDIPITKSHLNITVLSKTESPLYFKTDSLGCFRYKTTAEQITFVVSSPYHKTDTITRRIVSNSNNKVRIASDDYSLMLDYYANNNVKDWKVRQQNLNNLIANNAKIYRFYGNDLGVEVYSKLNFIQLISTPTNTLKKIKILDKVIEQGKIVKLKFIVQ